MHFLIANDDGISAPGIRALALAAREAGHRATIFAPDGPRSAMSHALTLTRPLNMKKVDFDGMEAYSVDGTPADCVRLGLYALREDKPDCVLSGVNNGANRGAAIAYSGTVGAAREGSLCGTTSVAVSLCSLLSRDFEIAARWGIRTAEWAVKNPLPRGEIYNLNVPYGMEPIGLRSASVSNEFIQRPLYVQSEKGYQLIDDTDVLPETDENSDLNLTNAGFASLSIITWNFLSATPMPALKQLEEACMKI